MNKAKFVLVCMVKFLLVYMVNVLLVCEGSLLWAVGPAPPLVEEYIGAGGAGGAHILRPQAAFTVWGAGLTQLAGGVGVGT